ncbi:MAG: zinc-binding dehydrogenase [Planctomycetes bacterium]|nr:zinc-binding dehydrogenase [Planctomycetota bacterium]
MKLAKREKFRTVNIVRREEQIEELKSLGGDEVFCCPSTDENNLKRLQEQIKRLTGEKGIRYAIDPVGGPLASAVIPCLSENGRLIGDNTDVHGVLDIVASLEVDGPWLILGTGGAARAAVIAAVRREMDLAAQDERRTIRSPIFTLLPSHRVSAGWRAAAIGFLTAAVVFGAATVDMRQTFSRIEAQLHTDSFLLEWPSAADEYIFDAGTRRVSFDRSDFSTPGEVVLWVKPETGEAFFYCKSLPWKLSGKKCELVAIDDEGVARQLADFMYEGKVISMEVSVQLDPGVRFAVREISSVPSADSMKVYTPPMRELNL